MKLSRENIDQKYRTKLTGPLRFGDIEQIRLLREWNRELEEIEEIEQQQDDPNAPVIKWRVVYSYRVEDEEIVEARTAEEAEKIIRDDYDYKEDFQIELIRPNERRT